MTLSLILTLITVVFGSHDGVIGLALMAVFLVGLLVTMRAVLRVPRLPAGPVQLPAATRRARVDPATVPELDLGDLFDDWYPGPGRTGP